MIKRNPHARNQGLAVAVVNKIRLWVPPITWMGAILWISSIPGKDLPDVGIPFADKAAHFTEFFVLGVLTIRASLRSFPLARGMRTVIITIVLATLFAAFDEWHQQFVPGRTVDITDLITNFIGLNAGVFIYLLEERKT